MMLDLFRKLPVSRLILPYLAGVLLLAGSSRILLSLTLSGLWLLLLYRLLERRLPSAWPIRWMPGAGFCCLWIVLGGLNAGRLMEQAAFPGEADFAADVRLVSPPELKTKSRQVEILVEQVASGFETWKGKHLQLYLPKKASNLSIGDRIRLRLKPQKPLPPASGYDFDYAAWLARKGLCGTAYAGRFTLLAKATAWNLRAQAERVRQLLLKRFSQAGVDGAEFALASALVLGETQGLGKDVKSEFSVSGISHILSVSGLHVAVVYAVLAFMLSFLDRFDRMRVPKQVLIVLLLFFYAFVTGLSPSVLRSAFMFSLLAMGKCLHRKSQTLNTVLFSAFVLLLWNPGFLYDLGFQLSYLAVFFIVVVHPKLVARWTPSRKPVRYLWEMLCLSLVAQLGTSPLTVQAFHTFPNYFLVNNLVAVPFSSLLIYMALLFLALSGVPWLGPLLAKVLNGCLHAFLVLVETTGHLPLALTRNLYPSSLEVVAFYVLLLALFMTFLLKRRAWFLPLLGTVLGFQVICLCSSFTP